MIALSMLLPSLVPLRCNDPFTPVHSAVEIISGSILQFCLPLLEQSQPSAIVLSSNVFYPSANKSIWRLICSCSLVYVRFLFFSLIAIPNHLSMLLCALFRCSIFLIGDHVSEPCCTLSISSWKATPSCLDMSFQSVCITCNDAWCTNIDTKPQYLA